MNTPQLLSLSELTALALRSQTVTQACSCTQKSLAGWESTPISLPDEQLLDIGTLIYAEEEALTLDEYHPDGTYYWSVEAPIAPRYFPYNRCKVGECVICGRCYLRYEESGAYHVERRIRNLDPSLIVDAPL